MSQFGPTRQTAILQLDVGFGGEAEVGRAAEPPPRSKMTRSGLRDAIDIIPGAP
jgi:hypothetical protein